MRAQFAILPDGRRHFHDGPIDLIIEASGEAMAVAVAYDAAAERFATILDELCLELPRLRATAGAPPEGVVARRMTDAVALFAGERFLTPMAAVAGAVAEEVLGAMVEAAPLDRAYVNNGGDIALHLSSKTGCDRPSAVPVGEGKGGGRFGLDVALREAPLSRLPPTPALPHKGGGSARRRRLSTIGVHDHGASFTIGLIARPDQPALFGKARITARDAARGVATSGWRGRSFSRGVADAVTVIARTASLADAAATLIANAVDVPDHPAITRAPARSRDPQSDLGDRLVTLDVGPLSIDEIRTALDRGVAEARHWLGRGLIAAAALSLDGRIRLVAADPSLYSFDQPSLPKDPRHALG
jgi:ApbE superfamily uncharacterized protein (UPF0280 family)